MMDAVRRYVRRIILLHVLLLALIVVVMLNAAREVYNSAREQAIQQENQRLQLLADQTARGVESYYLGIMQDLTLILRDETDPAGTQTAKPATRPMPATRPTTRPGGGPGGAGRNLVERARLRFDPRSFDLGKTVPVTPQNAAIMYRQLRTRVQALFVLDKQDHLPVEVFPSTNTEACIKIITEHMAWLDEVADKPAVSEFMSQGEGYGYHLIAVPAVGLPPPGTRDQTPRQMLVVAIVPIEQVKERFLDPVNQRQEGEINAALVDQSGRVLVAMNTELVGKNLMKDLPVGSQGEAKQMLNGSQHVMPAAKVEGITLPERIVASEQVTGLPGRHWTVFFFTPLAETEQVVQHIFRSVMIWALILTVAVAGVLVSTSTVMIRSRVRAERMRHEMLTRELEQARQIQLAWLPDVGKSPKGLEVAAVNLPASHISGDFYNWFAVGEAVGASGTKTALVIGDVTGHGMAAAFLMSTTQLLVRASLRHNMDPGRCLRDVNSQLCQQGFRGQFVTMGVVIVDSADGTVEVGSAGHMAPLVAHDGGPFAELPAESSLVLGVDAKEHYGTQGFVVGGGAAIALYTDGVVEAENHKGEQFGVGRLLATLNALPGATPQVRVDAVVKAVRDFCGGRELLDDITLVVVRVT